MTVLPDILAPNLDIVFCGTAVGNVSAQGGASYAGPSKRSCIGIRHFWMR
ncbi:MAG: hypothetical protein WA040_13255 [Anaerolineae bacterium]